MLYFRPARRLAPLQLAFLLTPAFLLTGCGGMGKIPGNVSGWASKVARPETQLPQSCAGWQKIELKGHSRYLLMQKDQKLLMNIDAHNLRGRNLGCWN